VLQLLGATLVGCGGQGGSSQAPVSAAAPAAAVAPGPAAKVGKAVPSSAANKNNPTATALKDSGELSKLRALRLMSELSDRDQAGLIVQFRTASPSERLALIDKYPALATMTDQQKQGLLIQIEKIVPVTNAAMLLTCECSDNIQREICVRESCSNQSEIQSRCNQACGTLAAFRNRCSASRQCETVPAL
jgi:hypothetical protein